MSNHIPLAFKTKSEIYEKLQDPQRIRALQEIKLLDTPLEDVCDNLTDLVCKLLDTPSALISILTRDGQSFLSQKGLPQPWASQRQAPLSHSFCQYVVACEKLLVVEDARQEPLLRDNLAIRDLNVIAYLGVPLATTEGYLLGSFCVIDNKPRTWTAADIEIVSDIAKLVMKEIELHGYLPQLKATEETLRQREVELRELNAVLEDQVFARTLAFDVTNRKLKKEVENRRRLEREVMKVAEAERQRIGQDLHDDLQQQLGSIAILTDMVHTQMQAEGSPYANSIEQIRQLLEESIDSTRRLAWSLTPVWVKQDGLAGALAHLVEHMETISHISCHFEARHVVTIQDDEVATHLYRIAQEASTNAFKYACARNLTISLVVYDKHGILRIEDDGVGISDSALTSRRGMGLQTMSYRADLIGGQLNVQRGREKGTVITCTFPLNGSGMTHREAVLSKP